MPSVKIDTDDPQGVFLGEVEVGAVIKPVIGQDVLVVARNIRSEGSLENVTVALEGEGAGQVQLAVDNDGEAGAWAAAGMPIMVDPDNPIPPDGSFSFWARAVPDNDETEAGDKTFEFVFRSVVKHG